ncbi:MAG: universal stress protein [Ignavibacteria bacterium]|nr:universal stress protein [Ignavibacteria bacterium]
MFNIKNIVVPTDFSKLSFSAFEYAKELAESTNAIIHLVYVMEKTPPFLASRSLHLSDEEVIQLMEVESKKQLNEIVANLSEDTSNKIIEVFRKGIDYEEIVNYAIEINCELIIIATHGRSGIMHSLLGSVAEKVIRFAKSPVLVIKPQDDEP